MSATSQVATPSGVNVIDPQVYRKHYIEAEEKYFMAKVQEVIIRCNSLIAKRVDDFQKSQGCQQPGLIVTVGLNSTETDTICKKVVEELVAVGYKAKYDSNDSSRWIEVAV